MEYNKKGQSKSKAVGILPKGGDAMSYEIINIVFVAMTFVVLLITLMIYLIDKFSKRK